MSSRDKTITQKSWGGGRGATRKSSSKRERSAKIGFLKDECFWGKTKQKKKTSKKTTLMKFKGLLFFGGKIEENMDH